MKKLITTLSLGLILSGCVTTGGPSQMAGTLLGGAGGALVGSRFGSGKGRLVSTALGAVGGSMLGGYVGQTMDTPTAPQYYDEAPEYYPPQYQPAPQYHAKPRRQTRRQATRSPKVYYEREQREYYYE
jgi:hypothetical protein